MFRVVQLSPRVPGRVQRPRKKARLFWPSLPAPPPAPRARTATELLLSVWFAYSGCFIERESHDVWSFWLASFTEHNVSKVQSCYSLYPWFIHCYGQIILSFMAGPHFIYVFIHGWTFGLFPFLSYYKYAVMDIRVQTFMDVYFHLSRVSMEECHCWVVRSPDV